jgi:hypothetical protein
MAEQMTQLVGLLVIAAGLWLIANLCGIGIAHVIEQAWRHFHG